VATFGELQTRVGVDIIDTPANVTAHIPTLIRNAVRKLQRKHNFKIMEAETAVLVTTAATRVLAAVPADFKEPRGLPYEITADGRVRELLNPANRVAITRELGDNRGGEAVAATMIGRPEAILISEPTNVAGDRNFEVYPLSDALSLYTATFAGQYRIVVPYWKYLTALSVAGDTNWFTVNADEWLEYTAAADAFFMDHDEERGTLWTQRAVDKWNEVVNSDKQFRLAGVRSFTPNEAVGGSRLQPGSMRGSWR